MRDFSDKACHTEVTENGRGQDEPKESGASIRDLRPSEMNWNVDTDMDQFLEKQFSDDRNS